MLDLIVAFSVLIVTHIILASLPIQRPLTKYLSLWGYLIVFSIVSYFVFVWVLEAWAEAEATLLWPMREWTLYVPLLGMPIAATIFVTGFITKNPAFVGQEKYLEQNFEPSGILKVTRHPVFWGVILWALIHLFPNGDSASVIFFTGSILLTFIGMIHIDYRRNKEFGDHWKAFCQKSSFFPFVSLIRQKQTLTLKEMGYAKLALSLAVYLFFLLLHEYLFGFSPFT